MARERSTSAPTYTVSRRFFSSEMEMMAGSRVMRTCERESVYSKRPARPKTLRVVSMISTFPSISTLLN